MSRVLRHFYPLAPDESAARKLVLKDLRVWLSRDVLKSAAVKLDPPDEVELRLATERLCAIEAEDVLDAVRTHHISGLHIGQYVPKPVRKEERSVRKPGEST